MFRRRRRDAENPETADLDNLDDDEVLDDDLDTDDDDAEYDAAEAAVTSGPWDVDDLPAQPAEDVVRVDLGGLRVPVRPDVELRVDMTNEGAVVAATLVMGASAMQVNAFAAPRTAGIWDDVRTEIAQSVRAEGGSLQEAEGPWGTELRGRVPTEVAGQGRVLQPARFVGVDGPRWFLRALLSGPAATDPVQAAPLEELFREVVVVRGKDAMAPRDQLALHLPRELGGAAGETPGGKPDVNRMERGPEIAETR